MSDICLVEFSPSSFVSGCSCISCWPVHSFITRDCDLIILFCNCYICLCSCFTAYCWLCMYVIVTVCCYCMFCVQSSTEERPLAEYLESKLINQSLMFSSKICRPDRSAVHHQSLLVCLCTCNQW